VPPTADSPPPRPPQSPAFPLPGLVILTAVGVTATFLLATPGGLLSKADLVGYAVCHRIAERSFVIAGRPLPLCARCSGTFIGALVGLLGQILVLRRHRSADFPPIPIILILVGFMLAWAADGLNSYMTLVGGPHVYEPQNWLRLVTGALQGTTLSILVYPVLNFTLWRRPSPEPAVRNLRDLGLLLLLQAGMVGLVLTQWDILLYPLALLGALGVLTLLTSVNGMLVLIVIRRENVANTWRDSLIPLLAGFTLSLIQIGGIAWVRYALTGTLSGVPPFQ